MTEELSLDSVGETHCPNCFTPLHVDIEQYSNVYYEDTVKISFMAWLAREPKGNPLEEVKEFLHILKKAKKEEL